MQLYTFLLYFLQKTLHVSDDTLIHHQEHIQTVITTSGTGRTLFTTVRWHGGVGTPLGVPTPPRQRTVVNRVRTVPDVVITVWMRSWWWMKVSSEICRAVCRRYNKTVYLHLVGQLLTLIHDARTHEHKTWFCSLRTCRFHDNRFYGWKKGCSFHNKPV